MPGRGARGRACGLRGDVVVTAVVDEELTSIGTQSVLKRVRADAAIVAEPTEMRGRDRAQGLRRVRDRDARRAAHGSRPDLGVDAIAKMGHVLVGLDALDRSLRERPTHALLGSGSLHAGVVAGGSEFSTYPERCVLQAERRTVPGESLDQVEGELQGLLDRLQRDDRGLQGHVADWSRPEPVRDQRRARRSSRLVQSYAAAGEPGRHDVLGRLGADRGAADPDGPLRPGGEGAHAQVEWVSVADVERCAGLPLGRNRILRLVIGTGLSLSLVCKPNSRAVYES